MSRHLFVRPFALVIALSALLAGCAGGGASPSASAAPQGSQGAPASAGASGPAQASAPASAAATELPGTKEFTMGFTSPGLSTAPLLSALDVLREQGYTIEEPVVESSELVPAGVASGQFQFGAAVPNGVMAVAAQGEDVKVLMARNRNEWVLYGRTESIKQCSDLADKRLAIHSEGAVSTAMVKDYVKAKCDGTAPQYVVIAGSPNRVAALIADQIDASPLELGDSLTIDQQAGDRFSLLSSFAEDLPDLQTSSIAVNGAWAQENPGTVIAVIKAVLGEYRRIQGDAAALVEVANEQVPDAVDPDTIQAAAEKYTELDMFPGDGGHTEENLDYTNEFFGPNGAGAVETETTVDQWADLSYLEQALAEMGG